MSYESTVRLFAAQAMAGRAPLEGAVRVAMFIGCEIPASWSKKKQAQAIAQQIHPTGKPDADNCIKAVFDAINAVVWKDDAQVVSLVVDKRYSDKPGVDLLVEAAL